MPDHLDHQDQSGDRLAARFGRSGTSYQLALGAGQNALGAVVGGTSSVRVPIGCNRAEILAQSTATATLTIRRRLEQPDAAGRAELVVDVVALALTAAATGRDIVTLPPDSGSVDAVITGMVALTDTRVSAVITFWRDSP